MGSARPRVRFLHHATVPPCDPYAVTAQYVYYFGADGPYHAESAGLRVRFLQSATVHHVIAMWSVHSYVHVLRHGQSALSAKGRTACSLPTSRNSAPCDRFAVSAHCVYVLQHEESTLRGTCESARSIPSMRNSASCHCYAAGAHHVHMLRYEQSALNGKSRIACSIATMCNSAPG